MFDDRHNYIPAPKPKNKEIWLTVATLGLRALWKWYKGKKAVGHG